MTIVTIGLDLAKSVFQAHGVDEGGSAVLVKKLHRKQMLPFFSKLPPCLIGVEACGTAHYWARTLTTMGHKVRLIPPAYVKAYVKRVVAEILPAGLLSDQTVYHINPTGSFVIGGPDGDAGLTGRKIIVDTYGGAAPHGGGAFSGKDPTKVDRSAAYVTRYLAKNIVAAGLARRCTIQIAYAIGVSQPLSLYVDTHGTGAVDDARLEAAVAAVAAKRLGGLTPRGIRVGLGLNKPIYRKTAAYGHFGRTANGDHFPWERTDLVEDLKAALG